jgi:feruloyl esterase
MTRFLFVFALAIAPGAHAANVICSGTLGGGATNTAISGDVTVPDKASCTLDFVTVAGNVNVGKGASLLVTGYTEPSTINGEIHAQNCRSVFLQGNVTVGGNVHIQSCDAGPLGFQGPDTLIKGDFHCQSNSGPCLAWLGKVEGNVHIQSNRSKTASDVSLVTVGGNLHCQQNSPDPTQLRGPSWVDGETQGQCAGFATTTTSIATPATPVPSCAALAALSSAAGFPVPNTVITSAALASATATLPARCIVDGYVNKHISPYDKCQYQSVFQVQLPLPANWNGRFMFQGGGGTEGSVPAATGSIGGTTGISEIANGYAIASQNGGHQDTDLAACAAVNPATGGNNNEFFLDDLGIRVYASQSIQTTTLIAKYLINQYYGDGPTRSYWVGCSNGGRQGMVMSQHFPQFFDGIVAGDPTYQHEAATLSQINGVQAILGVYLSNPALTPPGPTMVPQAPPAPPGPHLYPAFPASDQALFQTALLQTCDALDGVSDGVIDNLPACYAKFDPATATYTDYAGALGPANAIYPLQCAGAKNPTCLSPAQIEAAKKINLGPRSNGQLVLAPAGLIAPDPVSSVAQGYAYDGGWMAPQGIPTRKIGSSAATSLPGDFNLGVGRAGFTYFTPPCPSCVTLDFDFSTLTLTSGSNVYTLNATSPYVSASTSLDISKFVNYGHKIIWYHGLSDPGPSYLGTQLYYQQMVERHGGLEKAQGFSRFYSIPNMGHCNGGPATDGFDFLTPLVNWVENGVAPGPVNSVGKNFNAANHQVVGNYLNGTFINAPTTRTRPLCAFPQVPRFTGSTTVVNGVPVATNPADLANPSSYACIQPPDGTPPLPPH